MGSSSPASLPTSCAQGPAASNDRRMKHIAMDGFNANNGLALDHDLIHFAENRTCEPSFFISWM